MHEVESAYFHALTASINIILDEDILQQHIQPLDGALASCLSGAVQYYCVPWDDKPVLLGSLLSLTLPSIKIKEAEILYQHHAHTATSTEHFPVAFPCEYCM